MTYFGGPVMTSFTAYLIFWLPDGVHFSSPVSDENYERVITQYFEDIGGSPFYNIVTQYAAVNGTPSNEATLGGTIVDTRPYPRAGTAADPLLDADIQTEVHRIITAQGWPTGFGAMYFVFTGSDVQSCMDPAHSSCSQSTYCAYHYSFGIAGQPVIYANMPDAYSLGDCGFANVTGDPAADTILSIVSHEHFEAVTDPLTIPHAAWLHDDITGEIGDLCAYTFGPTGYSPTTPNVYLNGHPYRLQQEWSNSVSGCALSLCGASICPPALTQSTTVTPCVAGVSGNTLHYTIHYNNPSDVETATNVSVVETIPPGTHWTSGLAPSFSSGNVLTFDRGTLGVHRSGTVAFTATLTSPQPAFTTMTSSTSLTFDDSLSDPSLPVVSTALAAVPCGPWCGNGTVEAGEQCDDGNAVSGDGCDANCTSTACGNGVTTGVEQCDDGNLTDGDGCSSACAIESCVSPPSGVLAWWSGDGSANDISGAGHHGTLQNGATFAAGRFGSAFSFDGSDDYVSVADDAAWDLGGAPFTIELWINYSTGAGTRGLLSHRDWPSADGWSLHHTLGNLVFVLQGAGIPGGSASLFNYAWAPSPGTWHHLAVTRSGSAYSLYLDGSLVSTAADSNAIPAVATSLTLGSLAGQTDFFAGRLDEVQLLDRALNATEILALSQSGPNGQCKDCTAAGVPDGASCSDGLFCNGADVCGGGTCSVHTGDPCAAGADCHNACNEGAGNCLVTAGTPCSSDDNPCTSDTCDGTGACTHPPGNAGTECRAAAGVCDVAETCTGVDATCPPDGFASSSVTCRNAIGPCDAAELCTGTSAACPSDASQPNTQICRSSAGACDPAEQCTGSTTACPFDALEPPSFVCRPGTGGCDFPELCTGTSALCPPDGAPGTSVARPKVVLKMLTTPPGDDRLTFTGDFTLPEPFTPPLDPVATGARIRIQTASGATLVDARIPSGAYSRATKFGWRVNHRVQPTKWTYTDPSGVAGITRVMVANTSSAATPGRISFSVRGRKGDFGSLTLSPSDLPLQGAVALDASAGECGAATFPGPVPTPNCAFSQGRFPGGSLTCK